MIRSPQTSRYYFDLPPQTSLSGEQQAAINETEPLALSGGPGTGKSVVSAYRLLNNLKLGKSSLLLTYTKTLEHYLKIAVNFQNKGAEQYIRRTYDWVYGSKSSYDEIIIDEAQDLPISTYHKMKEYAKHVSYSADDAQQLYDDGCTTEQLRNLFENNASFELRKNFRCSKEILEFVKGVLPNFLIAPETIQTARITGVKPSVLISGFDDSKELSFIKEIIESFASATHTIAILLPGRNQVDEYFERIKRAIKLPCSKYHHEMEDFQELLGIHITTFKSAKGLGFDTVIIPRFDSMNWYVQNSTKIITERDFYVGMTRAKTNLYLICRRKPSLGHTSTYELS
jgi:superfamily I DNA/RNA helicase